MAHKRRADSTDKMVITRPMVEAGVAVFRRRDDFDFYASSSLEELASAVYEAMVEASGYGDAC